MPLVINTNIASLNAQRFLSNNTNSLGRSLERLASGYRINRAADDAAGLQISEGLRSQIRGVSQAIQNAQDATNLLSVAEGTLSVVQENLQRVRELVVQAANDTNGASQRDSLKQEIDARIEDINRITKATQYNNIKLLDNTSTPTTFLIQVGANDVTSIDTINISSGIGSATFTALASGQSSVNVSTNSAALVFLGNIDTALSNVSVKRARIGAVQNQLESAISNLTITRENFESAESRIRNVDVAKESAELTRNQILQQAAASILSQANQTPSLALSLLKG